ncbi:hypothetical protein FHG87_024766 [Trinorchestia longiramus]|nr:hypothetical protein FHG87_024766 [Trinorchestia longiramus]
MKEQKEEDFVHQLEQRVTDLAFVAEELDTKIRELTRLVHSTPAIMVNSTRVEEEDGVISKAVKEAKTKLRPSS